MNKIYLDNGLKAKQTKDKSDRALEFKEMAREHGVNGRDIDFLTSTFLVAVTKANKPWRVDAEDYRASIDARREKDGDDKYEIKKAKELNLQTVFVLYSSRSKKDGYFWVRRIEKPGKWTKITIPEFFKYIK